MDLFVRLGLLEIDRLNYVDVQVSLLLTGWVPQAEWAASFMLGK